MACTQQYLSAEPLSLMRMAPQKQIQNLLKHVCAAGYGYRTRVADSEGLLVGALALPWAFAGLLSSTSRLHAHPGAHFLLLTDGSCPRAAALVAQNDMRILLTRVATYGCSLTNIITLAAEPELPVMHGHAATARTHNPVISGPLQVT